MANDAEWVEDVRRWYFGGHRPEGDVSADGSDGSEDMAIGYEAASPGLQSSHWPDTLTPGDL
jgi:hypothetical protein